MWNDPIVEEIGQFGDKYAAQFNYDLAAMFRDLKQKQQQEDRLVVSFKPKTSKNKLLNQSIQHSH